MLRRYHDQLVATEAKFPIAENQVIVAHCFVIIGYVGHISEQRDAFSALTLLVGWQEGHPAYKGL